MIYELTKKLLTNETRELYNETRQKDVEHATKEEIIAMIQCALYGENEKAYNYVNEYEYKISGNWTNNGCVRFSGKTIHVTLGKWTSLSGSKDKIQDSIAEASGKIEYGVNPETVYPYALEMLFQGQTPHSKIQILDHFVDGNLAYVKTKVRRRLRKRNKHGDSYAIHEREIVIEKWGKHSENIKVKGKKFIEDFKLKMEQMRAPKAKVIEIVEAKTITTHTTTAIEIKERENQESFLQINTLFTFSSNYYLREVKHTWVRYTNGSIVWTGSREDKYDNDGNVQSHYHKDCYFKLNEFGGLVEVEENPIIFTELIDEKTTEPEVIQYVKHSDFYLQTSEDETEIINTFENHPYLKAQLVKETPHAREYVVENYVIDKSFSTYFAKYDDIWIHSNVGNRKVKQMLEVYALAEQLSDDEDEAV